MVNDAHWNGQNHTTVKVLLRYIQYLSGYYWLQMAHSIRKTCAPGTRQRRSTHWIWNGITNIQRLFQLGTNTAKVSTGRRDNLELEDLVKVTA